MRCQSQILGSLIMGSWAAARSRNVRPFIWKLHNLLPEHIFLVHLPIRLYLYSKAKNLISGTIDVVVLHTDPKSDQGDP